MMKTKEEFIKEVNKLRLDNKNRWYQFTGIVEGKEVRLKGYSTWLQIYLVDNVDYSGAMDIKVTAFKEQLNKPFNQ